MARAKYLDVSSQCSAQLIAFGGLDDADRCNRSCGVSRARSGGEYVGASTIDKEVSKDAWASNKSAHYADRLGESPDANDFIAPLGAYVRPENSVGLIEN